MNYDSLQLKGIIMSPTNCKKSSSHLQSVYNVCIIVRKCLGGTCIMGFKSLRDCPECNEGEKSPNVASNLKVKTKHCLQNLDHTIKLKDM